MNIAADTPSDVTKSERVVLKASKPFKSFLEREAKKAGLSVSAFVRQRCESPPEEAVIAQIITDAHAAVRGAYQAVQKTNVSTQALLTELEQRRIARQAKETTEDAEFERRFRRASPTSTATAKPVKTARASRREAATA